MKSLGTNSRRVYGIRQVDDLFVMVAYKERDKRTKNYAKNIVRKVTRKGGVYKRQEFLEETDTTTKHKFAGTVITITQKEGTPISIACEPYNKNEKDLKEKGVQSLPRFVSNSSMVPLHYKNGMQVTTYLRLRDQSSTLPSLINAMLLNKTEMLAIGYDLSFMGRAIIHLAHKDKNWASIGALFLSIAKKGHREVWTAKDDASLRYLNRLSMKSILPP